MLLRVIIILIAIVILFWLLGVVLRGVRRPRRRL